MNAVRLTKLLASVFFDELEGRLALLAAIEGIEGLPNALSVWAWCRGSLKKCQA